MAEYKSLESVIKETMVNDLRKRMQEAALKTGRVTAEVVSNEGKQDIGHDTSAVDPAGAGRVAVAESEEIVDEANAHGLAVLAEVRREQARALHRTKKPAIPKDVEYEKFYVTRRKSRLYPEPDEHEHVAEEAEPVEELMDEPTAQDPIKQKLAQQKQQLQKQKEQLRLQIAQQRAAKQEQKMKQNAEKALQKEEIDSDELDEWALTPYQGVRTFRNANRLLQLHQSRYRNLSRQNDPHSRKLAMLHRERAMELKRLAYTARDNPEKLPTL